MDYIRLQTLTGTRQFDLDPSTRGARYRVFRSGDTELTYDMDYDQWCTFRHVSHPGRTTWYTSPQWAYDSFLAECATSLTRP